MSRTRFLQLLEIGDVDELMRASKVLFPHAKQPRDRKEAEVMMHYARTQIEAVAVPARAYSHRWLQERGIPSGLPLHMRPAAERVEPVIASAVGVAVQAQSPEMAEVAQVVERAMADAVEDCYANGDTMAELVRQRMAEAKTAALQQMLGRH